MPAVEFEGLVRRYRPQRGGERLALAGVTFAVEAGERMVVVGPSGSGKTTLLRLVAGLEAPDAGTLRLGGRDGRGLPPERRGVAMVFQEHPMFPHLTAGENLRLGLRLRGGDGARRESRAMELVDRLGLGHLLARQPGELSGGERQRFALAGALALARPELVLLLDEPLAHLDGEWRARLRDELRRASAEGATLIHVTHDQSEAMALADRLVVLREGRVEQCGTPTDVYRRPATAFVGEFIGTPGMSLGTGRLEQGPDGGSVRLSGGGEIRLGREGGSCGGPGTEGQLGVRPEAWRLLGEADAGGEVEAARGQVEAVELAGHESLVRVRIGSAMWSVRAGAGTALRRGSEVRLALVSGGWRWFEAGSEPAGNRRDAA